MSNDCAPTFNLSRVPKEFAAEMAMLRSFRCSRTHYDNRLRSSVPPLAPEEIGGHKKDIVIPSQPATGRRSDENLSSFFPTSTPRYTVPAVKILLLGTYELGRQPFGLASPTAWLRKRGHSVRALDLSRQSLDESALSEAELIVFYLPMHTATRLVLQWLPTIRRQNPDAHLCACGLYGPFRSTRSPQICTRRSARRHTQNIGLHGILPRLQTPLPPLSGGPSVRRPISHRPSRSRPCRYPPASRSRRRTHHLRRSRFLQRHHPRDAYR